MILSRETAARVIEELKLQGKKVVFTNGCFDILHVGHLRYLNDAKKHPPEEGIFVAGLGQ